jgi:hypothetical protein
MNTIYSHSFVETSKWKNGMEEWSLEMGKSRRKKDKTKFNKGHQKHRVEQSLLVLL